MTASNLTVGTLRTELAVLADPAAVPPAAARLGRAVTERLPGLLADAAAPVLDGREGVIRVRQLRLSLDHLGPLDETVLIRLVAERLAVVLGEVLAAGGDVVAWPSHTAYLASYVETRLGLVTGPAWPYVDLAALDLLAPGEAAVQVLRARPALLTELGRRGAAGGDPARLAGRLTDDDVVALVAALAADTAAAGVGSAQRVRRLAAVAAPMAAPSSAVDRARAVLTLLLHDAGAASGAPDPEPPVPAALALVALAVLAGTLPPRLGRPLAVRDLVPGVPGAAEPPLPARLAAALDALLDAARTDPGLRAVLAGALSQLTGAAPETPDGAVAAGGRVAPAASVARAPRTLTSPVAGLALLLPGLARHDVARLLPPAALRAAVLSTLGEQAQRGAATDPLVAELLPAEPQAAAAAAAGAADSEVPPVPVAALETLCSEVRSLLPGRDGVAGWGDLLLATFADRLPGLRASSRPWLQRQFLHVAGRLDLTDALVHVTLEGPPLAVVLGMAGFDGPQGVLPHLAGRRLVLTPTGLRR